jgi:hypothetical protein
METAAQHVLRMLGQGFAAARLAGLGAAHLHHVRPAGSCRKK